MIVADIKLKISRPHPPRNRLHHAIFAQKIIQNPRDAHNVDRAGFRTDVMKVDRLKVIGYLRARHPFDIGRNLRKILIQVKLAQHIAAARHRKNRNLLSKHPRQGFPRVKFRHQTRFLDFADLVSGNVKPPMFLNFPLNPVFIK